MQTNAENTAQKYGFISSISEKLRWNDASWHIKALCNHVWRGQSWDNCRRAARSGLWRGVQGESVEEQEEEKQKPQGQAKCQDRADIRLTDPGLLQWTTGRPVRDLWQCGPCQGAGRVGKENEATVDEQFKREAGKFNRKIIKIPPRLDSLRKIKLWGSFEWQTNR